MLDAKRINIFKILQLEKGSENKHSNFLAWLLDPCKNHDLETFFIKAFFESINIPFDDKNSNNISIKREDVSQNGKADIVIKQNNNPICVIEVKFGANETDGQCKRYFQEYGYECKYILLDIDDKNYDNLSNKYSSDKEFNFSEIYKLATFKGNILPILESIEQCNSEVKYLIEQYKYFFKEKYCILSESEIKSCLKNIEKDDDFKKYKKKANCLEHIFIWYSVPNRYNEALKKILLELGYKILQKWKTNGSSLSVRFAQDSNCDFHDNEHFYLDHCDNRIILNFQQNINQAKNNTTPKEIISDRKDYFEKMLLSDDEFYSNLKDKIIDALNF